jgi:prevent-host-death family protein
MLVTSTDIQNNFGKYLEMAKGEEIIITRNGLPVARLLGMDCAVSFLSSRLVGLIPQDIDETTAKIDRLRRQ